jgi:hypothetical protein
MIKSAQGFGCFPLVSGMKKRKYPIWIELLLMLIIAGAMYLPFINRFGYYNDDWYLMYAARVEGSQVFHEMFSIDRPGRAYVMIPLYELLGDDPLYYNISAFVFRVLGAFFLLWLLRLIWPKRKRETFLIALLFLVFPGYLSMPNAIDFQSHLIGVALAFASLALGLLAIINKEKGIRILSYVGALLTGWSYLSQMEYYIGFEAVRVLLISLVASRATSGWKRRTVATLRGWLPFLPIPVVFILWRFILFQGERIATDATVQVGRLITEPLATIYEWFASFVQSYLNVVLLAWGTPLSASFNLDVSNVIRGIFLGGTLAGITILAIRFLERDPSNENPQPDQWKREMLFIGLIWASLGLLAVVVANRTLTYPDYSRYGLVSAAGAIMALVSALAYLSQSKLQRALLGFLIFSAAVTHYANGLKHAGLTESMRQFWWQVAWRVPQLQQGATLIASYPNSGLREDSFVWGPANHIYYPHKVSENTVEAGVFAILLDQDAVMRILTNQGQVFRKHRIVDTYRNFRNFVILTQPSVGSCLQVVDGASPEYSSSETESIMTIGSHSEVELILTDEDFKIPPQFLFGDEPDHGWCFYYEKAALERQRGNWDAVIEVGEQAFSEGFEPADAIEWIPFLQAYSLRGDLDRLRDIGQEIAEDPFAVLQACRILSAMEGLDQPAREAVETLFCD